MALRAMTLNVRGMRDPVKRRTVFNFLKDSKVDVAFLQETHSSPSDFRFWRAEWGSELFLSSGTANSCGVGIFFRRNLVISILNYFEDDEGRLIFLKASHLGKTFFLVNVYAPGNVKSRSDFFASIGKVFEDKLSGDDSPVIMGGDFNTHLSNLDKSTFSPVLTFSPTECSKALTNLISKFDLEDLWRAKEPQAHGYTRFQPSPIVFSRIDFFFTSLELRSSITRILIKNAPFSDHNGLIFEWNVLNSTLETRSPYWKFNSSLLLNEGYVSRIKEVISSTLSGDYIFSTPHAKWEFLLMTLRGETLSFSSHKKRESEKEVRELLAEIGLLSKALFEVPERHPGYDVSAGLERLTFCRAEVTRLEEARANAAMIRARVRWAELGERSTRYFFQMEKQRGKETLIDCVEVNGELISDMARVKEEIASFFSGIFDSTRSVPLTLSDDPFLKNPSLPRLSEDEREMMEMPLSDNDFLAALCLMSPNKAPGLNGFSSEFFKKFWKELAPTFRECFDFSLASGLLSPDQRRASIRLIPKPVPEADKYKFQKSRRPIALLNVDYKIFSKAVTNRLLKVIDKLITPDQLAYLKGRFICEHIRTVSDLISHLESRGNDGYIVFYDFEKAFDSIEWDFIYAMLEAMNFPPYFIDCIRLLNADVSATVIVNSELTPFFPVRRGCRQGDPISAYLFILAMQVFSSYYRSQRISCLSLATSPVPILFYADDTVTTHDKVESIGMALAIFEMFKRPSGLRLNLNKTLILPLKRQRSRALTSLGCRIEYGAVKYLGAWLNCEDEEEENRRNFSSRSDKYDALLNRWKLRGLSLIGRNLIVKTLCLSQLTYPLQFLLLPEGLVRAYRESTEKFIWNGRPKMKRVTTTESIGAGGLKIIDIDFYIRSLRIAWIGRFLAEPEREGWRNYFLYLLRPFGGTLLFSCNYDCRYLPPDFPVYYRQLIVDFFAMPRLNPPTATVEDIASTIIWNNRDLLISGRPFCFLPWIQAGIFYIGQLIKPDGTFFDAVDLQQSYGLSNGADWLRLVQIRSSVPAMWRITLMRDSNRLPAVTLIFPPPLTFFDFRKNSKINLAGAKSKSFYSLFSFFHYEVPTSQRAWNRDLQISEIKPYFRLLSRLRLPTWFVSFQWKVLHRLTPTGKFLYTRGIVQSDSCTMCDESPDNLEHFFFYWEKVREFWSDFEQKMQELGFVLFINAEIALLGFLEHDFQLNILFLWARVFIYKCKLKGEEPTFFGYCGLIKSYYKTLLIISCKLNKREFFLMRWRPFKTLFFS